MDVCCKADATATSQGNNEHRRTSFKTRSSFSHKMALFAAVFLCMCTLTLGLQNHMDTDDIQSFLDALQHPEVADAEKMKGNAQLPVASSWGIPDQTASLGKLFQFTLPKEALQGNYEVKELGKDSLPSWLTFDPSTGVLQGVPGTGQLDQEYFLEVSQSAPRNDDAGTASDVFSIQVSEDKVHQDTAATKLADAQLEGIRPIKCPPGSSVTVATIIVDVDLEAMMPAEKVGMMRGMCSHLKLPEDVLKVRPVGDKPMFDSSALVAGPGDVKQAQHPGAMIQWEVGCGNVHAHHMPILQQLESTSSDGSMGKAVEQGIVGWHVTNNKPHAPVRLKRQAWVHPTATPVPSGGPPTQKPVPTKTEDIHPTPTHKGHRTKTTGRHHKNKTKKPRKSKKTKKPKHTPAPTATDGTIKPTRPIDVVPTEIQPTASPGVSRTAGIIEPSMAPTATWHTTATGTIPRQTPGLPTGTATPEPTQTDTEKPPTKMPPGGTTPEPTKPLVPGEGTNFEPMLNKDIKRIEVLVGDVLNYKIPHLTFHDVEDGYTENLKLVLESIDGLSLPRNSWLKFNSTTQTLFGMPLQEHQGRQEYSIVAIDSGGRFARDPFEMVVARRRHDQKITHEFSMTLDTKYDEFMLDVNSRIALANKIAGVFGDNDMSKITVTRIEPGSVIYAWTNNSLPSDPCPANAIRNLLQYIITEENTLNETFVEAMKPYRILKAGVQPKGSCDTSTISPSPKPTGPGGEGEPTDPVVVDQPRESSQEDYLITIVVPALVIAAMLLFAGCIACFLYRRKRKGKLSDEDQHTFINKGIPIIFADELEDKPDPPTKPLIMNEEKPPQPPPEYQRSAGGSVMSTPPSDHKEPFLDTEDDEKDDGDMHSSLYERPKPLRTGSQGSRQPHAPPPYHHQPHPHVPP